MKRSPIESMIDAVVKCTICGQPCGCDCWITMRCPKCKRTKSAERDETDPPGTAVVQVTCDRCDNGDFAEVLYFDAAGNQLAIA